MTKRTGDRPPARPAESWGHKNGIRAGSVSGPWRTGRRPDSEAEGEAGHVHSGRSSGVSPGSENSSSVRSGTSLLPKLRLTEPLQHRDATPELMPVIPEKTKLTERHRTAASAGSQPLRPMVRSTTRQSAKPELTAGTVGSPRSLQEQTVAQPGGTRMAEAAALRLPIALACLLALTIIAAAFVFQPQRLPAPNGAAKVVAAAPAAQMPALRPPTAVLIPSPPDPGVSSTTSEPPTSGELVVIEPSTLSAPSTARPDNPIMNAEAGSLRNALSEERAMAKPEANSKKPVAPSYSVDDAPEAAIVVNGRVEASLGNSAEALRPRPRPTID